MNVEGILMKMWLKMLLQSYNTVKTNLSKTASTDQSIRGAEGRQELNHENPEKTTDCRDPCPFFSKLFQPNL
ncbi:hypothetical protein BpHYR1_024447 [Brachionus plicatilis]|uniref:Uncharacterized protein n=1 Tax=Brachionus plicatilis TaxID=10195 RepID=A0A3M7SBE6_BRAPC|nr:hypothetical protein BpHYR1_024447 [Brachionus plicatilis]